MEFLIMHDGVVIDTATYEASACHLVQYYNAELSTNDVDFVEIHTIH